MPNPTVEERLAKLECAVESLQDDVRNQDTDITNLKIRLGMANDELLYDVPAIEQMAKDTKETMTGLGKIFRAFSERK